MKTYYFSLKGGRVMHLATRVGRSGQYFSHCGLEFYSWMNVNEKGRPYCLKCLSK
jgi:hypothetical protein